MNRTILALGIVALALGSTSIYLWQELRQERASSERSLRSAGAQEADLREATGRQADEAGNSADELPARSAIAPVQTNTPQQAASRPSGDDADAKDTTADARQPRAVKLAGHRRWVHQVFPDLAAALDLQDAKAEALVNLLAEHHLEAQENPPFVPEGELDWDPSNKPDWVRKMEDRQRANEKAIAELLGEQKYRAWQDFIGSVEARRLVRELRPMLDGTRDSLREDQTKLLVDAIAEAQRQFVADSASNVWTPTERFEEYQERLREAAVPYLSPGQLRRFEQMLDRQLP